MYLDCNIEKCPPGKKDGIHYHQLYIMPHTTNGRKGLFFLLLFSVAVYFFVSCPKIVRTPKTIH